MHCVLAEVCERERARERSVQSYLDIPPTLYRPGEKDYSGMRMWEIEIALHISQSRVWHGRIEKKCNVRWTARLRLLRYCDVLAQLIRPE